MTTTQTQLTSVSAAAASIGHWLHQGNTHVSPCEAGLCLRPCVPCALVSATQHRTHTYTSSVKAKIS